MSHLEEARASETRRERERLTVRSPRIETALASLNIDPHNLADVRRFGNKIEAALMRWQAGRVTPTDGRRLTKFEADRKLRALLRIQLTGRTPHV